MNKSPKISSKIQAVKITTQYESISGQLMRMLRSDWFCTNVIIVRHGQSDNNTTYDLVRERFGDSLSHEQFEIELNKLHNPDCGMSATGHRQTKMLAEHIAQGKLRELQLARKWKVVTSPMKRCLLTTQHLIESLPDGTEVLVHPRFFESDGCYKKAPDGSSVGMPGMTQEEVESQFSGYKCLPGMERGWFADATQKETMGEFKRRADEVAQILWEMHSERLSAARSGAPEHARTVCDKDEGLIIVAHGNLLRAVVSRLLGTEAMFTCENTGLTHVQLWSDLDCTQRLPTLRFVNRVEHLLDEEKLISGGEIWDDHWIQEFLVADHE